MYCFKYDREQRRTPTITNTDTLTTTTLDDCLDDICIIKSMFTEVDYQNVVQEWKTDNQECSCVPRLTLHCGLSNTLKDDDLFYHIRRVLVSCCLLACGFELGELIEMQNNPKALFYAQVLETGRVVQEKCKPRCKLCFVSVAEVIQMDFPEAKDMPVEEIVKMTHGLNKMSNILIYIYKKITT